MLTAKGVMRDALQHSLEGVLAEAEQECDHVISHGIAVKVVIDRDGVY